MEMISGGGWASCTQAVIGGVGLVVAIAAVPATGGLSAGLVVGLVSGTIGTGWSLGDCVADFLHM